MLASEAFPALGTTAVVAVSSHGALAGANPMLADERRALAVARGAVEETVAAFDHACSRFREASELSALNRAAGAWVTVSPLLIEALQAALRAAAVTEGDVDPTIGEALIALGYDRDFRSLAADGGGAPVRQVPGARLASVPGWRTVAVDASLGRVRVPRGVSLDLGATAKALCADHCAISAHERSGCGVLASLGGDLAIAGPAPPLGWRVRVTDDHRAPVSAPGQWIALASGGLATSSTTVRRWGAGTERRHHIVDPATGRSAAEVWQTVSVAAASCLDANIAATAAIVRGSAAEAWLSGLGLPSRLVGADGGVRHVAGWPAAGDDLARPRDTGDDLTAGDPVLA